LHESQVASNPDEFAIDGRLFVFIYGLSIATLPLVAGNQRQRRTGSAQ
jgi:hypothetical protein